MGVTGKFRWAKSAHLISRARNCLKGVALGYSLGRGRGGFAGCKSCTPSKTLVSPRARGCFYQKKAALSAGFGISSRARVLSAGIPAVSIAAGISSRAAALQSGHGRYRA